MLFTLMEESEVTFIRDKSGREPGMWEIGNDGALPAIIVCCDWRIENPVDRNIKEPAGKQPDRGCGLSGLGSITAIIGKEVIDSVLEARNEPSLTLEQALADVACTQSLKEKGSKGSLCVNLRINTIFRK